MTLSLAQRDAGTPAATSTATLAASVSPTPTRTAAPTEQPAVCSWPGKIYNGSDFGTQAEAKACFDYCFDLVGYDVHGLDGDHDGVACESLP